MAWFRKRDRVIDLTKRYKIRDDSNPQAIQRSQTQESVQSTQDSLPSFFGAIAQTTTSSVSEQSSEYMDFSSDSAEDKRRKLAKRLMNMTEKIEDISNQIYHLQQRIELLERKSGVG
ncbi:MAG: hypothetical protein ABIB79_04860 [archaeon]